MSPRPTAQHKLGTPAERPDDRPVELSAVARQAGLRVSLVRRYVAFGLFEPCAETRETPLYDPGCAARLARAERLRRDLELNFAGAVLACELLDRVLELEERVRAGHAQSR
jgi:hypothetical protein